MTFTYAPEINTGAKVCEKKPKLLFIEPNISLLVKSITNKAKIFQANYFSQNVESMHFQVIRQTLKCISIKRLKKEFAFFFLCLFAGFTGLKKERKSTTKIWDETFPISLIYTENFCSSFCSARLLELT